MGRQFPVPNNAVSFMYCYRCLLYDLTLRQVEYEILMQIIYCPHCKRATTAEDFAMYFAVSRD